MTAGARQRLARNRLELRRFFGWSRLGKRVTKRRFFAGVHKQTGCRRSHDKNILQAKDQRR